MINFGCINYGIRWSTSSSNFAGFDYCAIQLQISSIEAVEVVGVYSYDISLYRLLCSRSPASHNFGVKMVVWFCRRWGQEYFTTIAEAAAAEI